MHFTRALHSYTSVVHFRLALPSRPSVAPFRRALPSRTLYSRTLDPVRTPVPSSRATTHCDDDDGATHFAVIGSKCVFGGGHTPRIARNGNTLENTLSSTKFEFTALSERHSM